MKNVLIVTHRKGFESDPVIDELRRRGIGIFRFNCDSGDENSIASYMLDGEQMKISLTCDGVHIEGSDISTGWCQQLPPYLKQASSAKETLQRQNLWAQQSALFRILDIPWINSPHAIQAASNKIVQLNVAQKMGLRTPLTLVSNDPQDIRTFAKNNVAIAKNLATPWITSGSEQTHAAFTKRIDTSWLSDDSALSFCPVIYQKFYKRSRDYRVVVIGDKYFTVACNPDRDQEVDVRRGDSTGQGFYPVNFDDCLISSLNSIMKALSVEYCSADFMEDKNGDIYFLEMNLCGAWWWVDKLYDGALCKAFADCLEPK